MKKTYAIFNLLVIIALIIWNYLANTLGIKGNTVGSLSEEYNNLFTPAGYAFAIWGLIFLGLLAHGIFQVYRAFSERQSGDFILMMGPWLILANLANGVWLWVWLNEYTLLSVIIMFVILTALIVIILKLNMERYDAPRAIIFWVWWPISLYSGWIAVAAIANVAAYLAKIDWQGPLSEVTWTIIMIIVATGLNLLMIYRRNMREFAAVGIWALVAISLRHWGNIPIIQWTALAGAIVLLVAASWQAYLNLATNPLIQQR